MFLPTQHVFCESTDASVKLSSCESDKDELSLDFIKLNLFSVNIINDMLNAELATREDLLTFVSITRTPVNKYYLEVIMGDSDASFSKSSDLRKALARLYEVNNFLKAAIEAETKEEAKGHLNIVNSSLNALNEMLPRISSDN